MPFYVRVQATNRSHRFAPTEEVRQLIDYCLSVTLEEYRDAGKIQLYEFMFSSNEYRLVGMDLAACLPKFMRDLNSLLSRELNALREIRGSNIEKGYELVELRGDSRILEHVLYTLAAPTRTNLVERGKQWKSVSSRNVKYGKPITVKRPKAGTWNDESRRVRTTLPDKATLVLDRPPVLEHLSDKQLRRYILDWLEAREERYAKERQERGIEVVGWQAAVRRDFFALPNPAEDQNELEGFSDEEEQARLALLEQREPFLKKYAAALRKFVAGVRDTLFPHGTWLMRVQFDCVCEPCESG